MYRPAYEHDACGVGLVVNVGGGKSHEIVENGLQVLEHMAHRGAEGADSKTGDGAGMMVQIPHEFILLQGIPVPEKGKYGVGVLFLPKDQAACAACLDLAASVIGREGLDLLAVRDVPVNSEIRALRAQALYNEDRALTYRKSHENPSIKMMARREWVGRAIGPPFL